MITIGIQIKRLTWDRFERACLLIGIDAETVFFGGAIGDVPDLSLSDGAALVKLVSSIEVDTGAMTPGELAERATEAVRGLFRAVVDAQAEAHRYRTTLDRRYPHLFKQAAEDAGPRHVERRRYQT